MAAPSGPCAFRRCFTTYRLQQAEKLIDRRIVAAFFDQPACVSRGRAVTAKAAREPH